jgi:hypothetical protein
MKHAFLVMTHNNFEILHKTLQLLDSIDNDFFIHVDKKAVGFNYEKILEELKESNVYFIERTNITWGAYSQIACELALLEAAVKGGYDYYHLLSGVDMPIKTCSYIHNFFEEHKGCNFLVFREKPSEHKALLNRIRYYYLNPQAYVKNKMVHALYNAAFLIARKTNLFQKKFLYEKENYRFGANWFSITDDLANYVVSSKDIIAEQYKYSLCCDEIFLHTLVYNSQFKDTIFGGIENHDYIYCLRMIDWTRGNPYVFRKEDLHELLNAGECFLFARKFDYKNYPQVVDEIYNSLIVQK